MGINKYNIYLCNNFYYYYIKNNESNFPYNIANKIRYY